MRGTAISIVCLLAAALPGTGVLPAGRHAVALSDTGRVALDTTEPFLDGDPPDSLPMPSPPSVTKLVLRELTDAKAPTPSGPLTYIPILLYHYIRINPVASDRVGFGLSTPPAMFREQMQYLADWEFHVISLHEAVVAIEKHSPLPPKSVVLTFDDGYADFYTAAVPIMRQHGFTATDFVISGRMGLPSFMTASEVIAADHMGFDIGAHTVDHVALSWLAPARALWEMKESKLTLESLLGHPVIDFAYPYGSFNSYDETEARTLGFETALSTLSGTLHSAAQLMDLSRIRIGGGMSLAYFARLVGGPTPTLAEVRVGTSPSPSPGPSSSPSLSPVAAMLTAGPKPIQFDAA